MTFKRVTKRVPAVAGLGLLLAACAVLSPSAPVRAQLPLGPAAGDVTLSPFYRWPNDMPSEPGTLLRLEPFEPQAEMPAAAEAVRLLYSSTDWRWNAGQIPVSGTLFIPDGPVPDGGWPVLAWAHGTLGISDVCAPSWTGFRDRDAVYMNRWLEQGFAVVATDYQGLGGPGPHPYSQWQAEGRSVLDAVRAAQEARPALLAGDTFIAGQSQGGGAALGAATLAANYAPELAIQGAVVTAPNSTYPDGPVELPPRMSSVMFLAFASGGLRDEGPQVEDILTPEGLELLTVARQACTREVVLRGRELGVGSPLDLLSIAPEELEQWRIPTTDLPQAVIGFPLLVATGEADETITPLRQFAIAAALCAAGNEVTWRTYEGMGHDGVMHRSLDDAFAFARARLDGQEAGTNCDEIERPGPPGERDPDAVFNDD